MKQLSNVLSEAILQALEDLDLCMQDPNYIINFNTWHERAIKTSQNQFETTTAKCSVCFAGSVMAKRLDADIEKELIPSNFEEHRNMLYALDSVRKGEIMLALKCLCIEHNIDNVDINQNDYAIFVQQMKKISSTLQALGY